MTESQKFWSVDCKQGDPDLFVCMACLNEVFQSKVPIQGCPGCGAVSTFEAFTLESIQEWGTEDLIHMAHANATETASTSPSLSVTGSTEGSLPV